MCIIVGEFTVTTERGDHRANFLAMAAEGPLGRGSVGGSGGIIRLPARLDRMRRRRRKVPPRVSIVFAVHNPSYAGNLLRRTQTCLRNLIELANRHRFPLEIVIVEWNPHPQHAPFREGLSWPDSLGTVRLRFIEVPAELHLRLPNADRIPIFEYLAKNVGLRRACGQYLLATNPDLVYSEALIRFLAGHRPAPGRFYRVDRSDLSMDVPETDSIDTQLTFCKGHVARVHAYFGSFTPRAQGSPAPDWRSILESEYAALRSGGTLPDGPKHETEATMLFPLDGLHRNAAGDFFLMARRHWLALRGYPEIYTHSHIDAIMCWMASSAGLTQTILPSRYKLYHQVHERSLHATFPHTDWQLWHERYLDAIRHGRAMIVNDEDWGLGREALREWVAGPRRTLEPACTSRLEVDPPSISAEAPA